MRLSDLQKRVIASVKEETRFIITVKTDNTGVSASNQILLPIQGTSMLIDWGDGSVSTHTQTLTPTNTIGGANVAHTYAISGVYQIKISIGLTRILFNNGGDRLKLLSIDNFGQIVWGTTLANAWFGCSNMVINAADLGNFQNVTNFTLAWRSCSSMISFPLINTSSGTNFNSTWQQCSSLTSFPLINTSNGTSFNFTWSGCTSLAFFPLLNVSKGINFSAAWIGTKIVSFPNLIFNANQRFAFENSWQNCNLLQDFPSNMFNTSIAWTMANVFLNTNLSQESIDNILISVNIMNTSGGTFNQSGGNAPSVLGQNAINSLRSRGWTINVTGGY